MIELRGEGNESYVIEQLGIFKNVSLNKFWKLAYVEWSFPNFSFISCIIMQQNLKLSQNWAFFTKIPKFFKIFGGSVPKMYHLPHFSQYFYQKFPFLPPSIPEYVSFNDKNCPSFWPLSPSNSMPDKDYLRHRRDFEN